MQTVRLFILFTFFYSGFSNAATITVNDSTGCSLRQAVASANSDSAVSSCDAGSGADTLLLASSTTYEIASSEITISSDITIKGSTGSIIQKDTSTGIAHRLFSISGATASLTFNSIELYGDFSTVPTKENGGCLYVDSLAALTMNNSILGHCESRKQGGGIYVADTGKATIIGSTISSNTTAVGLGGGIYAAGALVISGASHISENTADQGGGIYLGGVTSSLSMNNTSLFSNKSIDVGGGLIVIDSKSVELINTTITENETDGWGAGLALASAAASVINCTISNNNALSMVSALGGGLHLADTTITLENSIIAGNSSASGIGHEVYLRTDTTLSTVNATSQNLFGESSQTLASAFEGYVPASNIITASSDGTNPTAISSILATATDHATKDGSGVNGTTYAHALVSGSPALDTGNVTSCPTTDQRAEKRDVEGFFVPIKASNGNIAVINLDGNDCDLGAYESDL